MNLVVISKIAVAFKISDLDIGPCHENLRIGMKQQDRRPFHVLPVHQAQFFDQCCIPFPQYLRAESVTPRGLFTKLGDHPWIEVIDGNTRQGNRIPMFSGFP